MLYFWIVGSMFTLSLSLSLAAATVMEISTVEILRYCILFIIILSVVFYNRYTFFTALIGGALSLVIVWFLYKGEYSVGKRFAVLFREILELSPVFQNQIPMTAAHQKALVMIMTFALALFSTINIYKYFNLIFPTVLGLTIFFVPAYLGFGKSAPALILFFICFFLLLVKRMNLFVVEENSVFSLIAVPLCGIILLAAFAIPKPEPDPERNIIKDAVASIEKATNGFGKGHEIPLSKNGKVLGGPIEMGDEVIMEVVTSEPLYLAGAKYDTYTGYSWSVREDDYKDLTPDILKIYDTSPYASNIMEQQKFTMRYFGFTSKSARVITENKTSVIYTPPFAFGLWSDEDLKIEMNDHGTVRSKGMLPQKGAYSQEYISFKEQNKYYTWYLIGTSMDSVDVNESPELAACLELPEIPQRVTALTNELTEDVESGYEKLKLLESFLATHPYTLNTGSLPVGEDFVDHFLFTEKKGYCVYYASALAVMGRIINIPTRYVEGYVMPSYRNAEGNFTVTGKQAHAWTEAYFPEFGWVKFEPTASYYDPETAPTQTPVESSGESSDTSSEAPDMLADKPESSESPETSRPEVTLPDDDKGTDTQNDGAKEKENTEEEKKTHTGVKVFLVVVVLGSVGSYVVWRRYEKNKKFWQEINEKPNNEVAEIYYSSILNLEKEMKKEIYPRETALDYAERIGGQSTQVAAGDFYQLTEIFTKAAYSKTQISDEEKIFVESYYHQLLSKVGVENKFNSKYYINRYLLGRY